MVKKIALEKLLNEKYYPFETRSEVKEVKIRPRSFDEVIEPKGFLDLRDFTNLEYLLLENIPKIKGWDLTRNTKLKKIVFSNSDFNREKIIVPEKERRWEEGIVDNYAGIGFRVSEVDLPRNFPGGRYFDNTQNAYDTCLLLELSFQNNPELVRENIEVVKNSLQGVIFNLPTRKEKELQRQLNERISPEELAELLQNQMDLQKQLEDKERENRLLREQLEEILQRNEQERLLANIEFPS